MDSGEITRLLARAQDGDEQAIHQLLPAVYDELHAIALRHVGRSPASTLNATALVHEAYLKIFGQGTPSLSDRAHFFGVACVAMRHLLRDRARRHRAQKRGGDAPIASLDALEVPDGDGGGIDVESFLDLDEALTKLSQLDSRLADVVHLRFFGGLTVEEVAELEGVTVRTVLRDWRKARAFLLAELAEPDGSDPESS